MKKVIKRIIIAIVIIVLLFIVLLVWSFFGIRYHIKTEYSDSFTIIRSIWTEDIIINDDNSNYCMSLLAFNGKEDFKSICNSKYFLCYNIKNEKENIYICKLKKIIVFLV